ncbi:MAG: hypothetical protein COZ88_02210 [Candidatus Nealsonbacteria bacterium CG_4_8_14_3_um_filter_34_13]|nr:MAG: hypothetical protein COZ88_02210 [Candidatus Nealsonbacteria bacterium CG_4_8_14_3_um_filter_34_13]
MNIFYIILAYLLGSIPFGYLITKCSSKKNILEIGWRKTSGSNVFRNVGKWQGVLTGILDVGKGFLAVWLAQKLGLSSEIQIFSGVAAVTGHNWSCFLKFSGGRGIGTLFGVLGAIAPQILGFSLIPLVIFFLLWTASVGTILFLITGILLSIIFGQFWGAGLLLVLSLIPITIKRLSPIEKIKKTEGKQKRNLIKNRLIFDQDTPPLPRIKKLSSYFKKRINPNL